MDKDGSLSQTVCCPHWRISGQAGSAVLPARQSSLNDFLLHRSGQAGTTQQERNSTTDEHRWPRMEAGLLEAGETSPISESGFQRLPAPHPIRVNPCSSVVCARLSAGRVAEREPSRLAACRTDDDPYRLPRCLCAPPAVTEGPVAVRAVAAPPRRIHRAFIRGAPDRTGQWPVPPGTGTNHFGGCA